MININVIEAIKKDLENNPDDSHDDIGIRHDIETFIVEQIDSGIDPNDISEMERNCSFCGEPSQNLYCSKDCRTAEKSEFT